MKRILDFRAQLEKIIEPEFPFELEVTIKVTDLKAVAEGVKGKNFKNVVSSYTILNAKHQEELFVLNERTKQLENEHNDAVSEANRNTPGSKPSSFWVNENDIHSVNKYNEEVQKYNNQVELHRRLSDKADQAKDKLETAIVNYNSKLSNVNYEKAKIGESFAPALSQDVVVVLDKLLALAGRYIEEKQMFFEGLMSVFIFRKLYNGLDELIINPQDRRVASEIVQKMNKLMESFPHIADKDIIEVFNGAFSEFRERYHQNEESLVAINHELSMLPLAECQSSSLIAEGLCAAGLESQFKFNNLIDPVKLNEIRSNMIQRETELADLEKSIQLFLQKHGSLIDEVGKTLSGVNGKLDEMNGVYSGDFLYTAGALSDYLTIFDEYNQREFFSSRREWFTMMKGAFFSEKDIDIESFLENAFDNEFLTKTAGHAIESNACFSFFAYREKLNKKKTQIDSAINKLKQMICEIEGVPEKTAKDANSQMMTYAIVSLLPVTNFFTIFMIPGLVSSMWSVIISDNPFYAAFRKKFKTVLLIFLPLQIAVGTFFDFLTSHPFLGAAKSLTLLSSYDLILMLQVIIYGLNVLVSIICLRRLTNAEKLAKGSHNHMLKKG